MTPNHITRCHSSKDITLINNVILSCQKGIAALFILSLSWSFSVSRIFLLVGSMNHSISTESFWWWWSGAWLPVVGQLGAHRRAQAGCWRLAGWLTVACCSARRAYLVLTFSIRIDGLRSRAICFIMNLFCRGLRWVKSLYLLFYFLAPCSVT